LSGHPLGQAFVKNDTALIAQLNGGVDEEVAANITGSKGAEKFVFQQKAVVLLPLPMLVYQSKLLMR